MTDTAAEKTPEKPKAAAKKEAPAAQPLVDNGDGTITDPNSGLTWKKTDAWQDMKKFYTWQAHREYVDWVNKNKDKFGGYNNWRIPTKAESLTLVDKTGTKMCMDKNGTEFPMDPIFEPGCAASTWISECRDDSIIRMDLKIGVDTPYPGKDVWSSMRLVRKEGEAPPAPLDAPKPASAVKAEAGEKATTAPKAAPAVPKAASGDGAPPMEKKVFTAEQKAAMLKRAKAWAAEKAKKK